MSIDGYDSEGDAWIKVESENIRMGGEDGEDHVAANERARVCAEQRKAEGRREREEVRGRGVDEGEQWGGK